MLAKPGATVKEATILVRRVLRLALRLAVVASILALARAVLGWLAGDPGLPGGPGANGSTARSGPGVTSGGIPMSFDSWPAVPQAPGRSEGPSPVTPP